jgi:hypothetical protein
MAGVAVTNCFTDRAAQEKIMEYAFLGASGLVTSKLGFGTMTFQHARQWLG